MTELMKPFGYCDMNGPNYIQCYMDYKQNFWINK